MILLLKGSKSLVSCQSLSPDLPDDKLSEQNEFTKLVLWLSNFTFSPKSRFHHDATSKENPNNQIQMNFLLFSFLSKIT